MVDFMGASYSACVKIICVTKHFKTLVNKNIVDKKISNAIGENPKSYRQTSPKTEITPPNKTTDANKSIKNEKVIISLPPATVIFVVMVFMQFPKKPVHNVFMGEPRHKFHDRKCGYEY